ncbi:MAG: hypothetical protein CM15mP129_01510 [Chloroflexota bacterium]|nr:MAG: hypothetical protein CM15mP129_01510 [Chloroflexota bacterium]
MKFIFLFLIVITKIQPTNFKELKTKSFEKYLDSESVTICWKCKQQTEKNF